uniref:Uncharacterized protein n=1 Tax=Anopheles melas TaxID=34690 RepID=A0A182TZH1_9DIPT
MQPKSAITSTSVPIASGGGPAFERNGSLEPARKYKHSPFLSRRTASEYGNGSPKKESTLSSLGQSIFKNLTTSPFAQRKSLPPGESKLAYPPPASPSPMPVASATIYANGGGGGGAGAGGIGSSPSSPLLLLRKAHHDGSDTETHAIPLYKHHEPAAPLAPSQPSGIPVYQQQTTASPKHKSSSFFNTFSRGMKSGGRGDKVIDRGGTAAPPTMMSGAADRSLYAGTTTTNTSHQTALYQHHHQGQPNTSSMLHRHGALGGI